LIASNVIRISADVLIGRFHSFTLHGTTDGALHALHKTPHLSLKASVYLINFVRMISNTLVLSTCPCPCRARTIV